MKTTTNAGVTYTYNKYEVIEKINKTIALIEAWISENNYQISGKIDRNLEDKWSNLSKSQVKKIQRYCFWIERKPSLRNVNTFFGILSKYFKIERVHVKISAKEEAIQKSRKEWIKARNEADKALKAYKAEKGDFYKK
jgi:hypothetical protein